MSLRMEQIFKNKEKNKDKGTNNHPLSTQEEMQ